MRIGIFPQKCSLFAHKVNTGSDCRTMEMKMNDELYVENAVSCLADILYDWLLAMRKERE